MRGLIVRLEHLLGLVAKGLGALSGLALAAIVVVIVASVVMRRVVGSPLYYTEELVGLLLCASLFLALPLVTVQAQHVRVTFLVSALGARGRAVLTVLAGAVTLAFCVWYLVEALPWLEFAFKRNIRTEAASLRLAPWMAVPPVSVALCALLVLVRVASGSERSSFDRSPTPAE
jgi:TRAP-type C4-dicarboxylate transport system permease small subunit